MVDTATTEEVCRFFFEPVEPAAASPPAVDGSAPAKKPKGHGHRHRCRLCTHLYAQVPGSGYSNLMTHLRIKHPDWPQVFQSRTIPDTSAEAATPASPSTSVPLVTIKGKAGRKRGPVYAYFEEGSDAKRLRCKYCERDTPQTSSRLQEHLVKCASAPEVVKGVFAATLAAKAAAKADRAKKRTKEEAEETKPEPATQQEHEEETPLELEQSEQLEPPSPQAENPLTTPPGVSTYLQVETEDEATRKRRAFEDKLTKAVIATNTPWTLLDNDDFRDAMSVFHPGDGSFSLPAERAQTQVLDRLSQQCDVQWQQALDTAQYATLVVQNSEVGNCDEPTLGDKTNMYVVRDDRRRAFVVAARVDTSKSCPPVPNVPEILSVVATLPTTHSTNRFLCAPTAGAFSFARHRLNQAATSSPPPLFTSIGACMVQQSMLVFQTLVAHCEALEETLVNAVVVADALQAIPSLRKRVLHQASAKHKQPVADDPGAFVHASVASWRSLAMAVAQASRLQSFLHSAIAKETRASTSPLLRLLTDIDSKAARWSALRNADELFKPLCYVAALSELQTTTSGQLLALWIWLLGTATGSPLVGDRDAFVDGFLRRLQCYVESHFVACLVLDPRVHGAGLSVSGLRRARGVALRVAAAFLPELDETSFIRSYNDYMKQQGDFGEPGTWNAANIADPIQFWSDYDGDQLHAQLASVAKTVCAYTPSTCSMEAFWAAHVLRCSRKSAGGPQSADQHAKMTRIRHGMSANAPSSTQSIANRFAGLLRRGNQFPVDEKLRQAEHDSVRIYDVPVSDVLASFHDSLPQDSDDMGSPPTALDASWFDTSSSGLDKIQSVMESCVGVGRQQ